ncbi:MmpS family transport accessory protein [Phytohabitans houttuyneae]|uniref:MmpS family membrane protein n=1 Tax=Phytohabitans houttuyneae TaxID=1076126 RepID=A0A6V8K9W7_9ACTN|nr:MmpS family transport accessory protein [Phytohabitans houttuyneae]GFJ78939.1 hypothetical protein Phou_031190 [Phytohabitans houttuyneae]
MTYPPPYEPQPGTHPTQPVPPPPTSSPPTTPYPAYLGAPAAPPRPPRSNGPILAVVIALAVLLVGGAVTAGVLLVRSGDDPGTITTDPTRDIETPRVEQTEPEPGATGGYGADNPGAGQKVVYEVTGDGPVSLVFVKDDGRTPERATDTDLPWRKELTLAEGAALVSVTAIRSAGGEGSIECRITIDGEEVAKKSASGTFATATCSKLIF